MSLLQLLRDKLGAAAPPNPPILPVDAPITPDGTLGCGQPVAEIWNRGGTQRILALPGLTDSSWGRILADTSEGNVTLAGQAISNDPACCEVMRTVRPWKHELHIYRDNELQWCGPITEMTSETDSIQIKARDLSAWLDHRFVHLTHIYGGQGVSQGSIDTTTIFTDLVTDAMSPDLSPNLTLSFGQVSGVLAQGNYTPASFKTVGPLIRDLAKGSIDWYTIKRILTYTGGGASAAPIGGGGQDVTNISVGNAGFEINTAGWSVTNSGTITRDTAIFHSGVASGRVNPTIATPVAAQTTLTALIVGKSYTLKAWVRSSGTYCAFARDFLSIAGVTGTDFSYQIWCAAAATWYQASITFTATATSHVLSLTHGPPGSPAAIYIDDLTLTLNNPDAAPVAPAIPSSVTASIYLTDDDLAVPAKITLAGLDQETRSVVSDQQSGGDVAFYGEAPSPAWTLNTTGPGLTSAQVEYGLLEGGTTAPLADSSSATSQAQQRSSQLTETPVVLGSVVLSPNAGVTMDDLIPGSLVYVQLDRSCVAVRQVLLLRQVQVKTTPSSAETVTLTLEPTAST